MNTQTDEKEVIGTDTEVSAPGVVAAVAMCRATCVIAAICVGHEDAAATVVNVPRTVHAASSHKK